MTLFVRGVLWGAVFALAFACLGQILSAPSALAQSDPEEEDTTLQAENPELYWKCWRTNSRFGEGFTAKARGAGSVFATPYLPAEESDAVGQGRWFTTRQALVDSRFYRDPGLRELGNSAVVHPPSHYALPAFDAVRTYEQEGGEGMYAPGIVHADGRIESVTTVWQTYSGAAGANLTDEVKAAQREQTADTSVVDHVVERQVPYQGPTSVSASRLDPHAEVYNFGELGADAGSGIRLDTGIQEDTFAVMSGTVLSTTSGSTTTTQFEVGTRPSLITNEVSITSRNSPTLPEVNQRSITTSEAQPELKMVASTGYRPSTAPAPGLGVGSVLGAEQPSVAYYDLATALEERFQYPAGFVPIGPFTSDVRPGVPVVPAVGATAPERLAPAPACFVAESNERHASGTAPSEYRAYCWMVRHGSVHSAVGATRQVSLDAAAASVSIPGFATVASPAAPFAHLAVGSLGTTIEIPRHEASAAQPDEGNVLGANTPGERARGLAPDEPDDSPNDSILVTLNLHEEHRRDPSTGYSYTDVSGGQRFSWRLFGDEMVAPSIRRFVDAHANPVAVHHAYRQPYLLPPFWGFAGANERLVPYLHTAGPAPGDPGDTHRLISDYGADSVFRWPVRLDEMNYYLFRADGFTQEHAGDLGHVWNLSYSYVSGLPTTFDFSLWGFSPSLTLTLSPQVSVTADPVPEEVEGTSGRTNVAGWGAYHLNPFSSGKVYYPLYDTASYKAMVDTNYASYANYHYASDGRLHFGLHNLIKAGVAAPEDRASGPGAFDANSRFQFSIDEGIPAGLSDAGSREHLLTRLGFSNEFLASEFAPADVGPLDVWPNRRMDPAATHVLYVTFYEGRLADRWRLKRSGELRTETQTGGKTFLKGAADLGINAFQRGGDLGRKALDAVQGRDIEYAAVPTFQFRRVMCRIIVPPEGVVLPSSGWDGLEDTVTKSFKGLVEKITSMFDRLLAWLEDIPRATMEGGARAVEQGTCHGGEFMGSLGDPGIADSQLRDPPAGTATGPDVEISHVELSDIQGRNECGKVTGNRGGLGTAPCADVARSVGDPACMAVPAVEFDKLPDLAGIQDPFRHQWVFLDSAGNPYPSYNEDVRLYPDYSYATGSNQIGSAEIDQLGIPLAASIRADLGYPHVRMFLPYPTGDERDDHLGRIVEDAATDPVIETFASALSSQQYNGFILYIRPDPKASGYSAQSYSDLQRQIDDVSASEAVPGFEVPLNPPIEEVRLVLPLYYLRTNATTKVSVHRANHFDFGGVPLHRQTPDCRQRSAPVGILGDDISDYDHFRLNRPLLGYDPALGPAWTCSAPPEDAYFDYGSQSVQFLGQSDWDALGAFLDYLWYLGDGFEYQFSVAAYRGWPGLEVGYTEGPRSAWTNVRGGAQLACTDDLVRAAVYLHDFSPRDPAQAATEFGAYAASRGLRIGPTPDYDQAVEVAQHYRCAVLLSPGGELSHHGPGSTDFAEFRDDLLVHIPGFVPRVAPRRGVLGSQAAPDLSALYRATHLFGPSACGNIWNGTPSSLTWDSPIVRTIWNVSWVLALLVLLVLVLWEGLSLTYDGVISDGRGGAQLKSLFPRFALALLLAGLSLFLCRVALTLAADVTCFVSHATGMTFWGFLGTVIGLAIGQTIVVFGNLVLVAGALSLISGPGVTLLLTAFLLAFFTVLLFLLWYGIKLFFAMVGRILLLLVLAGLSPIAFAMLASTYTSHWTKRWVTLFLGTAFQQVAVLMVLYAGASLAKQFFGSGQDTGIIFWSMFLQLLMVLMSVYLASKVPDFVNPSGRGLLSGFGQSLGMVATAAMVVATAGIGAIGGALAGAGAGSPGLSSAVGRLAGLLGDGPSGGSPTPPSSASPSSPSVPSHSPVSSAPAMDPQQAGFNFQPGSYSQEGTPTPSQQRAANAGGDGGSDDGSGSRSGGGAGDGPSPSPGVDSGSASAALAAAAAAGGGGGFRSRLGGFMDRVGRGAYHGAVRGQNYSRSMQQMLRHSDFSAVPLRGYSISRPVDAQSLRNYVNRVPIARDADALNRIASQNQYGGRRPYGPGGRRRGGNEGDSPEGWADLQSGDESGGDAGD